MPPSQIIAEEVVRRVEVRTYAHYLKCLEEMKTIKFNKFTASQVYEEVAQLS